MNLKIFHDGTRHWILKYGFREETTTIVGLKCQYETCYEREDGLYTIWIGVDFESLELHLYLEYSCGGEIARNTFDISDIDVDNEETCIKAIDDLVYDYLYGH